jgi:hypothetical protein
MRAGHAGQLVEVAAVLDDLVVQVSDDAVCLSTAEQRCPQARSTSARDAKNFLKGKVSPGRANAVANIILLSSASNIRITSKAPSKYLAELISEFGKQEVLKRLSTVLVNADALDAALSDDYDSFLTARGATLQQYALGLAGEGAQKATARVFTAAGESFVDDSLDTDVEPPTDS